MSEDRLTISSSARVHPDEVARHTFGTTRRGFDPAEVRSFLEYVARELVAAADREQELRRALAEAEHRAANPVLDDATLTGALGHETARVLRSAHDAATELVGRAENDAARLRAQALEEADQLHRHAEQSANDRTVEADAAASELRRRVQEETTSKVEGAKLEAETLVTQTRAECRAMVQEAQELRARVLTDLARRRRVLHSQIEQLRAGRERLAETILGVRHDVDHIADDLFRAEDEARLAAEAAGRHAAQEELSEITTTETAGDGVGPPRDLRAPDGEESDPRQSVEELFARLRAEAGTLATPDGGPEGVAAREPSSHDQGLTESAVTGAITEPAVTEPATEAATEAATETVSAEVPSATDPARRTAPRGRPVSDRTPKPGPRPTSARHSAAESHPGTETQTAVAVAEPRARASVAGDEALDPIVSQRDEVLAPVVATLARRLKRALQDDHNDILDRLRAKGSWTSGALPSNDEHAERYILAATDQLTEAARAGATHAGGKADEAPEVDDVAAALASDIVAPLRRRLDGEGPSVEAGDESALVELVGATFREWKGARTERLAGDHAVFAFARAALAAVPGGTALRWVVDDDVAQCPDCDDNALAGPVPSGEAFPPGHPHPPAHAGCRCLLAPANA